MNLIALMSFFDEDRKTLMNCLYDLDDMGVGTVVAVDGAYEFYPLGCSRSDSEQVEALYEHADALGLSLLVYQPSEVWEGNEQEKRQAMIDLAYAISRPGDWFVIWDCDYRLSRRVDALKIRSTLSAAEEDFGFVSFTESRNDDGWHEMQMFIRAQSVKMDGNHHTYLLRDGRRSQVLRRPVENMADAADLSFVRIRHGVHERDLERRRRQAGYYAERDRLGIES